MTNFKRRDQRMILLCGKQANSENLLGQVLGGVAGLVGTLSVLSWLGKVLKCVHTVGIEITLSLQ